MTRHTHDGWSIFITMAIIGAVLLIFSCVRDAEAKPTVVLLHGGGWAVAEHGREVRVDADRFERWGYKTVIVDYRPWRDALPDSLQAYDRVARKTQACVYGESAGGQLALMIAVKRHPACVIAQGAPLNLVTLDDPWVRPAAEITFSSLAAASPALLPFSAPTLLEHHPDDVCCPIKEARRLARRKNVGLFTYRRAEVMRGQLVNHGWATNESTARSYQREHELLRRTLAR